MYDSNTEFCIRELLSAIARKDPDAAYYWAKRLAIWLRPEREEFTKFWHQES